MLPHFALLCVMLFLVGCDDTLKPYTRFNPNFDSYDYANTEFKQSAATIVEQLLTENDDSLQSVHCFRIKNLEMDPDLGLDEPVRYCADAYVRATVEGDPNFRYGVYKIKIDPDCKNDKLTVTLFFNMTEL